MINYESFAFKLILEYRGHSLTACNTALSATPHRPLNPKWPTGSGKRLILGYLTFRSTFAKKVSLFDHSFYENLKNPKWPPGGPKMADGVWKGVYP